MVVETLYVLAAIFVCLLYCLSQKSQLKPPLYLWVARKYDITLYYVNVGWRCVCRFLSFQKKNDNRGRYKENKCEAGGAFPRNEENNNSHYWNEVIIYKTVDSVLYFLAKHKGDERWREVFTNEKNREALLKSACRFLDCSQGSLKIQHNNCS